MSRDKAIALLFEARRTSWKKAVLAHVANRNLRDYYMDLQRAAWLAPLGLNSDSVALDIGSGYGAITHSLALSVGEVYSVEAVPERIEFTQERLRQEGVANVSLVQASAIDLPFFENSFDLIVVNGVLEWIGDWDLEGAPRTAQLRFLGAARRLLRQNGVLVIGIENRFGAHALRGQIDHSGKSYTSLVPRWLATQMVRRAGSGQYAFLTPNPKKQYRTYTYSSRGYQKLLDDAGFEGASVYCAEPGYNRPYDLVALDRRHPAFAECRAAKARHDEEGPLTWKSKAKSALRRLQPMFANEFVIIAGKNGRQPSKVELWLKSAFAETGRQNGYPERDSEALRYALHTRPFSNKTVIQAWSPVSGPARIIAKVSFRNAARRDGHVASEYENLERVNELFSRRPELCITAPRPSGIFRDGNITCSLESLSEGTHVRRMINRKRYKENLRALKADFARLAGMGVRLTAALQSLRGIPPIDPAWRRLPDEVAADPVLAAKVTEARYFSGSGDRKQASWIQHGDFVVGNIFFQEETGRFEIIDWGDLAIGYPPLYDIITLIIQPRLWGFIRRVPVDLDWEQRSLASFSELFLEKSELSKFADDLLCDACKRLDLNSDLIPSFVIETLLVRIHYNRARGATHQAVLKMLRAYATRIASRAPGASRQSPAAHPVKDLELPVQLLASA